MTSEALTMVQTSSEIGKKNIKKHSQSVPCARCAGKKYCTNCINCNTGWKCHSNRLMNNSDESGADVGLLLREYGFGVRKETIS